MRRWLKQHAGPVVASTLKGWNEDDGFLLSAAMAYYAAFSLFPLLLVLIAILGFVLRVSQQLQSAREEVLGVVQTNLSPWLADQLRHVLAGVQTNAGLGGPLGLAALIFAAIGIFAQFEQIFDRVWKVPAASGHGWLQAIRDAVYDRLVAFLMLLAVGFLLLVIIVSDLVLAGIREYAARVTGGTGSSVIQAVVTLALYTGLFTVVYKVFPPAPVRWREALAGGLLVGVVWQVGQKLMSTYLIGEHYSAYGVVGSFIAVMLWMYYSSAVVFLGAEFVKAICAECAAAREAK
jgi:membrane protein